MLESVRTHPTHVAEREEQATSARPEQPSVSSLFDVVRRRRLLLIGCVVAAMTLGVIYIKVVQPKYSATVTLLIDFRRAQLSQTDVAIVDQGAVDSQIELLRSEKILLAVVRKLNLIQDPEFNKNAPLDAKDAADPGIVDVAVRRAISIINGNLSVSRVGKSYLVGVTFNSLDPNKAARIANEVADEYTVDQIDSKIQVTKDENAWLATQVNELRARAALAYQAVQEFKMEHDINPLRDLGVERDLVALDADAAKAHETAAALEDRLRRATQSLAKLDQSQDKRPDAGILRSFNDPEINGLISHVSDLDAQLATAKARHDDQAKLDVIVDDTTKSVKAVWDRVAAVAQQDRSDWVAAYGRQQLLESRLAEVRLKDAQTRVAQGRLRELETSAATSRSLYESYLNQLTNAARRQTVPSSDARVISAASVPLLPTWPKLPLLLFLSSIGGIGLGLVATFVLESTDDTVRTRRQLESASGVNCLGVVPELSGRQRPVGSGEGELARYDLSNQIERGSWHNAHGARSQRKAAWALTGLRYVAGSSLGFHGGVIGVTSAVAGEGKSTIAVSMASSALQAGRKVLLVDCNVLHPTLTTAVTNSEFVERQGSGAVYGLSEVVLLKSGLEILPLPPSVGFDSADLPDIRLLSPVLAEARAVYDCVIVDLPAILPQSGFGAIAHMLDVVLLVTRWGKTKTPQVERAVSSIRSSARLLGFVFNCVDLKSLRRFEGSQSSSYADLN